MSTLTSMRARVNLSFDGYKVGEIVEADPVLCKRYFDNGWLTEVDEHDNRVLEMPEPTLAFIVYDSDGEPWVTDAAD